MAKAKKLPSGSWRTLVFSRVKDGKRVYESFTAPTRAESEAQAAVFLADRGRVQRGDLTVSEAVEKYIESRTPVLSPATIRGYRTLVPCYAPIAALRVKKLTPDDIQQLVNQHAQTHAPKGTRNMVGLLSSALKPHAPTLCASVRLPAKVRADRPIPSDDDIRALLRAATDELRIAILLAIYGPLRRGSRAI